MPWIYLPVLIMMWHWRNQIHNLPTRNLTPKMPHPPPPKYLTSVHNSPKGKESVVSGHLLVINKHKLGCSFHLVFFTRSPSSWSECTKVRELKKGECYILWIFRGYSILGGSAISLIVFFFRISPLGKQKACYFRIFELFNLWNLILRDNHLRFLWCEVKAWIGKPPYAAQTPWKAR